LPILLRSAFANNVSAVDLSKDFVGHVDIPRLRAGKVGGFFWSVICPLLSVFIYLNISGLSMSAARTRPWRGKTSSRRPGASGTLFFLFALVLQPSEPNIGRDTLEQIDVARLTIDKYPDASFFPVFWMYLWHAHAHPIL
jgi:hypothetical protein